MEKELKQINNEIKVYINEAKFISNKCRNNLLKELGKTFSVNLPLENFANIDAQLTEDGDIIMRGDKYESTDKVKSFKELEEKYQTFKEKADKIISKKETTNKASKDIKNIANLFIIGGILLIYIVLAYYFIINLITGDFGDSLWLLVFVIPYLIPSLKANLINRLEQAKTYLERRFKK